MEDVPRINHSADLSNSEYQPRFARQEVDRNNKVQGRILKTIPEPLFINVNTRDN